MSETTDITGEVADLLADLRHISDRMARFETIPQAELAAFDGRKRALINKLEPGFHERQEQLAKGVRPGAMRLEND